MKKTKIAIAAAALSAMLPNGALIEPQGNSQTTSNEKRGFYSMKAAAGGVAELILYGDVGWDFTAKQIATDLRAMGKITQLKAYIQSGGGDVIDGMAIYNILARWPCQKSICIESIAASMASVICMAFDTVIMPSNAFLMIHSNWGGAVGTAEDLREYADLLDKWRASMGKAYQDKAKGKLSEEQLAQFFKEDTWLSAQEAVALGLADQIIEPLQLAASIDTKRLQEYENMPDKLKALFAMQGNTSIPAPAPIAAPNAQLPAPAPLAAQPDAATIQAAAIAFNTQRMTGINAAFAAFPQLTDLKNECLADANINAEIAKDRILAKLGENTTPAATMPNRTIIHSGNGNIVGDSIRAHLMARSGHAKVESENGYSSYNLRELARASLVDRGIGIASMNPMQMVGLAFTHSSSDFGNILLDVANKSVLMGWETAEETFERWTKKGQLGDFKIAKRVGLGDFNSLRQVREGAEYQYITVGDHAQQIALATYGELFSITRQAIINDDMSMLTDIPMKMGFAAKGTIGDLVYAVLTQNPKMADGIALFHASHGNLGSGAPSVAALDANRQLMRKQKSGDRTLNIRPDFVLCPVALETTMNQIIKSSSVKGADVNAGIANPIQNFAEVIAEARLDDHSDKEWFLSAGQGRDTIEVAYLDGIDTPYIEQQQGFTIDGVATKVRIDAGVAPLDYRGLSKSTGV
ncbi:ATP-dependent Clp protease proteolytic subunit [Shewanella sp. SM55]|uniref:ClpP-like prohead protease/major capsid protein fusion protein n=1 Tax=Shewanella sp. SM55 TaxID=2912800 RepID=UPI0021D834EB|nr:ClpP-like prohead protease/major capsid protein fusion protein [Shewanella sp. SM55]MCU8062535.1 ATP-dependent Clp protease proteolytic subunit [Shewanella sp. SM55]